MTTNDCTLTKDDILALRKVCDLPYSGYVRLDRDGARIDISKTENINGFETRQSRTIPLVHPTTETAGFFIYGDIGGFMALSVLAREGDQITVYARRNNNQYLDDAGLNHDELLGTLTRNGKTIVRDVLLAWSCCPNNSARAIQS